MLIDSVQQRWRELSRRERVIITLGLAVASAMLLFILVIEPLWAHMERLDRSNARLERALQELAALGSDRARLSQELARLDSRMGRQGKGFALMPFLEEAAEQARIRNRITGMQPQRLPPAQGFQEMTVEVKLEQVEISHVLDFLFRLEGATGLVQVKRLQLRPRFDDAHLMEATIGISSYARQ